MTDEQTLEQLRSAGLTSHETEVPLITDEPKVPAYLAYVETTRAAKEGAEDVSGFGIHPNDTLARVKAVAECLERLSLRHPSGLSEPATATDTAGATDPASFLTYSPAQYENHDEALAEARAGKYRWISAVDRASGAACAIPAQMVYLCPFDSEFPLRREHSSPGAALGARGSDRAFVTGLLEVVERDAAVTAYLTRRPLKRIVDLTGETARLAEYCRRYLLEPYLFDTATGLGIPTILAITIDETGLALAVNVGMGSGLTYAEAMHSALLESLQMRRGTRLAPPPEKMPDPAEVVDVDSRLSFWYPVSRVQDLAFWLQEPETVSYASLEADPLTAQDLVDRLAQRGFHIFTADVSLPEVHAAGFEVIKVVVPELHPFYLDERAKPLYSVHHGVIGDDPSLPPHPIL